MKTGKSKAGIEVSESQLLTADDLLTSSDELTPLEIPELSKDDKPGIVYIKLLSAGDVLDFAEGDEDSQRERMLSLIAKAVVNQDSSPLFSEAQVSSLRNMRVDVFTRLSKAVTASINLTNPEEDAKSDLKASPDTDSSPTN